LPCCIDLFIFFTKTGDFEDLSKQRNRRRHYYSGLDRIFSCLSTSRHCSISANQFELFHAPFRFFQSNPCIRNHYFPDVLLSPKSSKYSISNLSRSPNHLWTDSGHHHLNSMSGFLLQAEISYLDLFAVERDIL